MIVCLHFCVSRNIKMSIVSPVLKQVFSVFTVTHEQNNSRTLNEI